MSEIVFRVTISRSEDPLKVWSATCCACGLELSGNLYPPVKTMVVKPLTQAQQSEIEDLVRQLALCPPSPIVCMPDLDLVSGPHLEDVLSTHAEACSRELQTTFVG